jgi:thiamine-phosphate pyrophosphorylase
MESGVRMVQIREKDLETRDLTALVHTLLPLVKQYKGSVLLNDRIDLVLALGADGVHLRADSLPVLLVRRLLGPDHLIGVSAHSAEDVQRAEDDGADFVVLGPIFDTPSKRAFGNPLGMEVLQNVCRTSRGPIFAIGGITPRQVPAIMASGAYGIAVISSILQAPSIPDRTRELLSLL